MCAVYCLVRSPEQLEPLVDRLQDAGVRTEDIAIVLRRGTAMFSSQFTGMSRLVQALWDWSAASAALWWPLVRPGWGQGGGKGMGGHAVISLELYRAGRPGAKR